MKNYDFIKIKNRLAIKSIGNILFFSIVGMAILMLFIDVIYNDYIADFMYTNNRGVYYFCVANKSLILFLCYAIIFVVTSFIVIRNSNENMVKIISAMDQILKEPSKEINLPSDLMYLTLLTDEKEIPKNLQEKYMKIALDKSLRVEELTNQFFDITRYNLHSMPITKQSINLSFLVEQLVEESYPMLQ